MEEEREMEEEEKEKEEKEGVEETVPLQMIHVDQTVRQRVGEGRMYRPHKLRWEEEG